MNVFFDAIVDLLLSVCRSTGLAYPEVNMLIYCGIIPASWALVVWCRQRRYWWLFILHISLIMLYLQNRRPLSGFSRRFYDGNIAALEWGANAFDIGYIGISLLTGIVFPVLIYAFLLIPSRRWAPFVYLTLLLGNLVYYGWVLHFFAHQPDQ